MQRQPVTLTAVHRQIRHAWRRYVLPAYTSRDVASLLVALVVASASLDELLLAEDHPGETPIERLGNASASFSNYAGLRAARRVRHQAVHRLGYPLCRRIALPALEAYARALWEHGVELDGCHPVGNGDSQGREGMDEGESTLLFNLVPITRL
jgi:hypothetical protein